MVISGKLPQAIRNVGGLYEGNLIVYYQVIFNRAQNLQRPYHNFRHMFHVMWLCWQACWFYQAKLTQRERRNLLIAALFHDFDHPGMMGEDDLNVERAIRGLRKHILPEDLPSIEDIESIIRVTEYPPRTLSENISLCCQIIRDADLGQALGPAWIQQVIFGLSAEWGKKPIDVLRSQKDFLGKLELHTEWAREMFPQTDIQEKIDEAQQLLDLLEMTPA